MTAPARTLAAALLSIVALIASIAVAMAHPHVFVDARAQIVFDGQGRISAVRNIWKFDEAFSAFAIQGLDKNHDGKLEASELAPLAKINVTSLKAYDFFTYVISGSAKHPFLPPVKYHLDYTGSRLTLFFTLPLEQPATIDREARVEIFDPEYFVAFTFLKDHPVSLENAPAGCTASYEPPHMLDASTMSALAAIPVAQHDLPPKLLNAAAALANVIHVDCPGAAPAAVAQQQAAPTPPMPELSPDDPTHRLPATAVAASAAAPAGAVRPTAEILMASGVTDAKERTRTFDGATATPTAPPQPDRRLDSATAAPILHIRSEEEIASARRKADQPAEMPSVLLLATALALVIAIAVCGFFLVQLLRRAR